MKTFIYILLVCGFIIGCNTPKTAITQNNKTEQDLAITASDTVKIANEELEYEILIIEPGFNVWLESIAKPEGFYSQEFLENRNYLFVTEWNQRVFPSYGYNTDLYQLPIDYQANIDYGYDVNYKLYNYFIYFQLTYKQQLTGFVPRI